MSYSIGRSTPDHQREASDADILFPQDVRHNGMNSHGSSLSRQNQIAHEEDRVERGEQSAPTVTIATNAQSLEVNLIHHSNQVSSGQRNLQNSVFARFPQNLDLNAGYSGEGDGSPSSSESGRRTSVKRKASHVTSSESSSDGGPSSVPFRETIQQNNASSSANQLRVDGPGLLLPRPGFRIRDINNYNLSDLVGNTVNRNTNPANRQESAASSLFPVGRENHSRNSTVQQQDSAGSVLLLPTPGFRIRDIHNYLANRQESAASSLFPVGRENHSRNLSSEQQNSAGLTLSPIWYGQPSAAVSSPLPVGGPFIGSSSNAGLPTGGPRGNMLRQHLAWNDTSTSRAGGSSIGTQGHVPPPAIAASSTISSSAPQMIGVPHPNNHQLQSQPASSFRPYQPQLYMQHQPYPGLQQLLNGLAQQRLLAARANQRSEGVAVVQQPMLSEEEDDDPDEPDSPDMHSDMRLDIDDMTYEELLELGENIGNVRTGLSEDTIMTYLKQQQYPSLKIGGQTKVEPCCICQEEYVDGDGVGVLECAHAFHTHCIKQWLMEKNVCPICKTTALVT